MTMKFMQRSAAKSTASSPSTPNGPPAKKPRLSKGESTPGTPTSHDHEILQTALAEEARKQQEASDKAAQYSGETKWVLSFQEPLGGKREESMNVRKAGFAELDAEDDSEDEEDEIRPTRMQFGGGVKKKADASVPFAKAEDSESETSSSEGECDPDDALAMLIGETKREVAAERRGARQPRTGMGNHSPRVPPKPVNEANEDMYVGNLTTLSGGLGRSRPKCTPRGSAGRGRGRGRK